MPMPGVDTKQTAPLSPEIGQLKLRAPRAVTRPRSPQFQICGVIKCLVSRLVLFVDMIPCRDFPAGRRSGTHVPGSKPTFGGKPPGVKGFSALMARARKLHELTSNLGWGGGGRKL